VLACDADLMDDATFQADFAERLAQLPSVEAVMLGGSRARGHHSADSDWDFAIYYRGVFEPQDLRNCGWEGVVSEIGGWGGGVMNGGAWLNVDGRRVDVHYRDLNEVDHWCAEALAGRFKKELLMFYVAGIPTYVSMAELATGVVLSGVVPEQEYPEVLAREALRRWTTDSVLSLGYASSALRSRGDLAVGLSNAGRALIERAHAVLASRGQWVLNEKGMVDRAGLTSQAESLMAATDAGSLLEVVDHIRARFESSTNRGSQ
jgi:Polymerase beta, Nucleotidyltransferase